MLTTTTSGALVSGAARSEKEYTSMKVKIVQTCVTPNGFANIGDIVEVETSEAKLLIGMRRAVPYVEELATVAPSQTTGRAKRPDR